MLIGIVEMQQLKLKFKKLECFSAKVPENTVKWVRGRYFAE